MSLLDMLKAEEMDEADAEAVLRHIYQLYHERAPIEEERRELLPFLTDYGFRGLAYVLNQVIQSAEVSNYIRLLMQDMWRSNIQREPTDEEVKRYDPLLRYLGADKEEEIRFSFAEAHKATEAARLMLDDDKGGEAERKARAEEALAILEEIIYHGIPYWETWHQHGRALVRLGRHQEAIPSCQRAIEQNPDDTWEWSCHDLKWCYDAGGDDGREQRHREGLDYFRELATHFPNRWAVWHECGWFAWKLGDYEVCDQYFKVSITTGLNHPRNWSEMDLVATYREQNKLGELHDYFASLVKEPGPHHWAVYHYLAELKWKHQENGLEEAISLYQQAISVYPDRDMGWFWSYQALGWCEGQAGRFEKARSAFEAANRIDPASWHAWNGLGWATRKLGAYQEAIKLYTKAIEHNPDSLGLRDIRMGIGKCHHSLKQYRRAWKAYQDALTIDSSFQAADNAAREVKPLIRQEILDVILEHMDLDEIRLLCFRMDIDHEELEPGKKSREAMELVKYCERHQRVEELIAYLHKAYGKDII